MKKINILLYSAILIIALSACDDSLDREVVLTLTKDKVTKSYNNSLGSLNAIYTFLPNGFSDINGAMMASASDEAEHTLETSTIQKLNTGSWNALNNPDDSWSRNFKGIRAVNLLLVNLDSINLDYYKLDSNPATQLAYQTYLSNMKRWKYEARFLRAFFYFDLTKRYGGVPILTTALQLDADYKNIKRNTLAECIQFISDECDSAANVLPTLYADADFGRATRGAALALKSRVLLYAASDLYNDYSWAGIYDPYIALPNGNDATVRKARWKAAADAAKAVIDISSASHYKLSNDYSGLFKSFSGSEIILAKRGGSTNTFEKANYPVGYDLGNSGTTPSQNLVDDYEMIDGTEFDWNNPLEAANPYANRDPRLGFSILTNNTLFNGRPVECWTGGRDGNGVTLATKTGYYLLKYIDPGLNLLQETKSVHTWILIRLSEIYLNYVEALNEYDPGNSGITTYFNKIRQRPGVGMPGLAAGLSQDAVRTKIRHERRIELAFEDHRLWDVRRWMIATSVLNVPLRGVEITKNADTFTYKVIDNVEDRVFRSKMYFYPIPQNDINITKWTQNPLW